VVVQDGSLRFLFENKGSVSYSSKDLKCVVRHPLSLSSSSSVPIKFPRKYIIEFLLYFIT
jgi:hypothetical protein